MNHISAEYQVLIQEAKPLAVLIQRSEYLTTGYVGSALITKAGNIYKGVSIDAACGVGFCGEHSAIAQMLTNNESQIKAIVAINHLGNIVPPCGRCREMIHQANDENLNTQVILKDSVVKLSELLPIQWQNNWK